MSQYDPSPDDVAGQTKRARDAFMAITTPRSRLPAWLRWSSHQRVADAQRRGLHWWYRHTHSHAICTCGLSWPHPAPDVGTAPGHRQQPDLTPTDVFATHDAGGYLILCQRCGWNQPAERLADLPALAHSHPHARQPGDHHP